jgi:hypothetical protein
MTGTPSDEVMLRERFEAAVGDLSPDIGRLVAAGTAGGRGAVRRRRIVSGIAAAAVAVIAAGSISYAAQTDLFGRGDAHVTDNGEVVELVPATPRGLAAAIMSHVDSLGAPVAVGGTDGGPQSQDWQLSAQVAYDAGDGVGVEVDVYVSPQLALWPQTCGESGAQIGSSRCEPTTLDDGTPAYYLEYGAGSSGRSAATAAGMIVKRDDQLVAVIETVTGTTDLVIDRDGLTELVADPAVGISTTADFNSAGEEIPDFQDDGLITSDSGHSSGSATAPPPTPETATAKPQTPDSSSAASSGGSN